MNPIRVGILTLSDRCSRGAAVDLSGPALAEICREQLRAEVAVTRLLPDEPEEISATLVEWSALALNLDLILTTGGTGLAPRDNTPEAALRVLHRRHEGLMELARLRCMSKTPRTFLSRGVAGTIHRTLVLTLPGSPRGATEMLSALLDVLPHAIDTLRGDVLDDGRPPADAANAPPSENV